MRIGHLHSSIQNDLWNNFPAILIRQLYEDDDGTFWKNRYGKNARTDLRYAIYPEGQTYQDWYNLSKKYDLVFLSINFDIYPSHIEFQNFAKKILNRYSQYQNNYIIGAGNETYEKRLSVSKVKEVIWDIAEANKDFNYPICFWNEKIRTSSEKNAFMSLIEDGLVQQLCKYVGIQSLETEPNTLNFYIKQAKNYGFEVIDVELMTKTDDFFSIKKLFDIDKNNGIEIIFIGCPYISKEMFHEMFKKYALDINGNKKDKFKIINYAKEFITWEKRMRIADFYYPGDKGDKVIDIFQDMLKQLGFLSKPINFGNFDAKTEQAVKDWQTVNGIPASGIITKWYIWQMIEQMLNPASKMRQLIIYCS